MELFLFYHFNENLLFASVCCISFLLPTTTVKDLCHNGKKGSFFFQAHWLFFPNCGHYSNISTLCPQQPWAYSWQLKSHQWDPCCGKEGSGHSIQSSGTWENGWSGLSIPKSLLYLGFLQLHCIDATKGLTGSVCFHAKCLLEGSNSFWNFPIQIGQISKHDKPRSSSTSHIDWPGVWRWKSMHKMYMTLLRENRVIFFHFWQ